MIPGPVMRRHVITLPLSPCIVPVPRYRCARAACPTASVRSGLRDDVAELDLGKSPVEDLSGKANTMVADVMDIDRTPELLAWVFSGLFGSKGQTEDPDATLAESATSSSVSSSSAAPLSSPPTMSSSTTGPPLEAPAAPAMASISLHPLPHVPTASPSAAAASEPQPAASTSPEILSVAAVASGLAPAGPLPESATSSAAANASGRTELATVGGGCFWCTEACFRELQGVLSVASGYAGGHLADPTYQQVSTKTTGHAEVVQIQYDPAVLSYRDILQVFMSVHDATTPNRSGNDVGPQYRSIILTHNEQQREVAEQVLAEANRGLWFGRKVCTELAPLKVFYPAESYHQRYYSRNPGAGYCVFVVRPKLQEFRRKYAKRLRQDVSTAAM